MPRKQRTLTLRLSPRAFMQLHKDVVFANSVRKLPSLASRENLRIIHGIKQDYEKEKALYNEVKGLKNH